MQRIKDKINEIEKYLSELEKILPESYSGYKNNNEKKAACERYFERIVESLIDLGHLFIKYKRFVNANEDIKVFDIFYEKKFIKKELCENLKNAKGMRNIISNEYGKIDDEPVYEAITSNLIDEAEEFINNIKDNLK